MNMIKCNSFVKRQTAESSFSYFAGTWDELERLVDVAYEMCDWKPGYKDGVVLVSVPSERFYSGVVRLNVGEPVDLVASFRARRDGEDPVIEVRARGGRKEPALEVEVVIYRHDVLGVEAATDAPWEIVSINARCTEGPEPMTPIAMARNMLGLAGGTPATYTAEELVRSIDHWSRFANVEGK